VLFCFCLVALSSAAVVWDGSFNSYSTSTDLDKWSWNNQVGEYQTYIYGNAGTAKMSDYVSLSENFKNPSQSSVSKGARTEINTSSRWNGQTMLRTELIANMNRDQQKGKLFYKFSMKQGAENSLNPAAEHQLVFFESHFCEIKFGGQGGDSLQFNTGGNKAWSQPFIKDTWFNFAFEVNYDTAQCGLWFSKNGDPLQMTVAPIAAGVSPSDFHVGILKLPDYNSGGNAAEIKEWLYYSGVSVEDSL